MYILLESEYLKKLDEIENIESIKKLKAQLKDNEDYRSDLSRVREKYRADNADLIKQEVLRRKAEEIRKSGLLEYDDD